MATQLTQVTFPTDDFLRPTNFQGDLISLGGNSPASAVKTYWENNTNIPVLSVSTAYNHVGAEYSFLFSKGGSANYGSILRWGYTTPYIEILRRNGGSWKSDDWEKISAGYADKAGADGNGNIITNTYLPLAGGTMTGQIVLADNGYKTSSTVGYSVDKYGNFKHQSSDASNYWNIQNNAGTNKFSVYWETGNVTAAGNITAPKFIGTLDEANLQWGGKNFSGSYGCIDAALMDELGANRFQFIKASAITVEYSRDAGATWTDYGATDAQKQQIFAQGGNLVIGKADSTHKATEHPGQYQLRITIDTGVANIYSYLNKFVVYVSTNNSGGCLCKIQKALQSTPTTFVDHTDWITVTGWSGYNVLNTSYLATYGNTASNQYGRVRFVFKDTESTGTGYNGLSVYQIKAFGGVGWICPSTMAKTGHLYSYDQDQNATFPNVIQAPYHRATTKMTLSSGKISQITTGHTMLFADGIAISNPTTANDQGWIRVLGTGESDTIMEIATGDDGGAGEQIVVRQYNTSSAIANEATLLDKSGNTSFPKNVTATKFIGALQGNADTATSATSASKLGSSNVGSATQPIYLNAGSPAACTYSLNKTVPSDAVFTDTNNAVTQTATDSTDATYELLFSNTADNTTRTEGARKSQYATFNPSKKAFTFGSRASGSIVGEYSFAEGEEITVSGEYSHAEGSYTTASDTCSHAEGHNTKASGPNAHAEGDGTVASSYHSHAEGYSTTASGDYAHAEGQYSIASGMAAHAEGAATTASGGGAHAEGCITIANHRSQHVFGEYNVPDPTTTSWWERGNYIEIVGNGTDDEHLSNARELDWKGNELLAGKLTCTDVISLESTWDGARSSLKKAIGKSKSSVGATVTVNANSYVDKTVNFGKTFSSAPIVVTQLTGSAANNTYRANTACYVTATTTTSFTVRIYNSSAAQLSISFNWIAMEP